MLHRLLVREWILMRRALIVIAGVYAAFQAYFVCRAANPRLWLVFAAVYASFLSLSLFLREDKFQAAAWSCTLPVRRRDLVRARFVSAWVLVAGALAAGVVLAGVMPGSRVQVAAVLAPPTLFLGAAVITIILALMLPFTIRFGLMGVMIFLVLVQVLGMVVLLFAVNAGTRARPSRGALSGGIEALTAGLVALKDLLSPPGFYLAAALVLILINWLGYRFAAALFNRREF
jgi:hypothetical protein